MYFSCAHEKERPVYDALAVQEDECAGDLSCVKSSSVLLELPRLLNMEHEITSVHKLHHEEQSLLRHEENTTQTHKQRMRNYSFNLTLIRFY